MQGPLSQAAHLRSWDLNSASIPQAQGSLHCPGRWLMGKGWQQGWGCPRRASTSILTLGLGTQSGGMTKCTPEAARRPGTPCRPARGRRHPSFLVSFHQGLSWARWWPQTQGRRRDMEERVRLDTFTVIWPPVAMSRQIQLSGIFCGVVCLSWVL